MEHAQSCTTQDSTILAHREPGTPQSLQVCYSGVDNGRFVLGDGTVTDTTAHTMQIHGDYPVKPGMELALMIAMPNSDDHLCLVGGQVSSFTLHSFEVDLRQVSEKTREHLETLVRDCQEAPEDVCYAA